MGRLQHREQLKTSLIVGEDSTIVNGQQFLGLSPTNYT